MSENYSEYNETNISVVSPNQASQYQSKGKWRMAAREKIIQIVQRELKIVRIYNWKYLIAIQHMREFVKYLAECFNHTKPKLYANHKLV